jgi:hypothetical protein
MGWEFYGTHGNSHFPEWEGNRKLKFPMGNCPWEMDKKDFPWTGNVEVYLSLSWREDEVSYDRRLNNVSLHFEV